MAAGKTGASAGKNNQQGILEDLVNLTYDILQLINDSDLGNAEEITAEEFAEKFRQAGYQPGPDAAPYLLAILNKNDGNPIQDSTDPTGTIKAAVRQYHPGVGRNYFPESVE